MTDLPYADKARETLGPSLFDYMIGRTDDAFGAASADANEDAFGLYRLIPRLTNIAAAPDLQTTLGKRTMAAPIVVGAFAGDKVFHAEGIAPVARAAAKLGLDMVLSEETVTPLEQLTALHDGIWLQLRAGGSVDRVEEILGRAAELGIAGLILTLMAPSHPRPGQRPGGYDIGAEMAKRGFTTIGTQLDGSGALGVAPLDALPRWDVAALKRIASAAQSHGLPLMIKGVLHPEDANALIDCGIGGLVVSNIGLRQSGRWALGLDQLPEIAKAVPQSTPLLLDGGVRHGSDVLIAALLGAHACVVARPVLSALCAGGGGAVESWLSALIDNLYAMTLWMGAAHPSQLTLDQLVTTQ